MELEKTFSIGDIAAQTGVNPATLRAWERRYGLIKPHRTPKGHRVYFQKDISLVKNILFILSKGYAISKVKQLLQSEHIHLLQADNYHSLLPRFQAIAKAIGGLNHIHLDNQITALFTLYSPEQFADEIVPRLLDYLETKYLPSVDLPMLQWTFLLDLLNHKLYQYLYQNIHKNAKAPYLIVGYRCLNEPMVILKGLLLSTILKAYEHRVDFNSGSSCYEEIFSLSSLYPQHRIVIVAPPEIHLVRHLLMQLNKHQLKNCSLFVGQSEGFTQESDYLLNHRYASVYGELNQKYG